MKLYSSKDLWQGQGARDWKIKSIQGSWYLQATASGHSKDMKIMTWSTFEG